MKESYLNEEENSFQSELNLTQNQPNKKEYSIISTGNENNYLSLQK